MEHQADVHPQLRLILPDAGPGCEKNGRRATCRCSADGKIAFGLQSQTSVRQAARERQPVTHRFVFLSVFAIFPKLSDVVWGVLFARCSLSFTTARLPPRRRSASRVYRSASASVVWPSAAMMS